MTNWKVNRRPDYQQLVDVLLPSQKIITEVGNGFKQLQDLLEKKSKTQIDL